MQRQQAYQDTYCREAGALPVPFLGVACDVEATHGCRADTGGEGNLCFAPSVAVGGRLNASNRAREIFDFSNLFCQWSYCYCLKTHAEMQDVKRRL